MIGSDFIRVPNDKKGRVCSECYKKIRMFDECLISMRGGRIKKIVCSEDCRLEFDYRIYAPEENYKQEE